MPYKKYIKRDGKLYGPYIYHSKRVDGKVVSEYHGQSTFSYGKFFLYFSIVFVIAFFVYLMGFSEKSITGKAVFDLNADYQDGKLQDGKIRISLQEGELIPATSKVIFENNGSSYQYNLLELTSEETIQGNFYVHGAQIFGSGQGFGMPGEKQIFPSVYFTLGLLIPSEEPEAEIETEINGEVSADNDFVYGLEENQRAEIKPRSVITSNADGTKQLDDNDITLDLKGNELTVSTDYFETETGFGSDFIGEDSKEISIDISNLNMVLQPGDLKVSVVSEDQEIFSVITFLEQEKRKVQAAEIVEDTVQTEKNINVKSDGAVIINNASSTEIPLIIPNELIEQERAALIAEFGNISVEITEAKTKNGFIVVRYELGDFWVENSYSQNLSNETLDSFMEADRIKWLKDISKKLSEQKVVEEDLPEYIGTVSIS